MKHRRGLCSLCWSLSLSGLGLIVQPALSHLPLLLPLLPSPFPSLPYPPTIIHGGFFGRASCGAASELS